ncbi:MAG: Veg family protein [Bombilactobacillus mellifer]|nr:Veg family protein [Bombilactobacillus mellifer]
MPNSIAKIKNTLDSKIGQHVEIKAQAGRKKVIKRNGILRQTFRAVFIIDLDEHKSTYERVSYSYTDLLTKNVELSFDNN